MKKIIVFAIGTVVSYSIVNLLYDKFQRRRIKSVTMFKVQRYI